MSGSKQCPNSFRTFFNHVDGLDESDGRTRTTRWRSHAAADMCTSGRGTAQRHLTRAHHSLDDKGGAAALKRHRILDGETVVASQSEQNAASGARNAVVTDDFERGLTMENENTNRQTICDGVGVSRAKRKERRKKEGNNTEKRRTAAIKSPRATHAFAMP
jgi:hypothetical protein